MLSLEIDGVLRQMQYDYADDQGYWPERRRHR